MKDAVRKIADFYHSGNVAFYVSLLGPLTMGTIHLVSVIMRFDWITMSYCAFHYLLTLLMVWQWAIERFHLRPGHYAAGIISVVVLLIPLMASLVMTIQYKDAPVYAFEWLVYAYAFYGTLKMVFAIHRLVKKEKTDRMFVVAFLGLLSAMFTLQMMQFRLIMFAGNGTVSPEMYVMELVTQGWAFLVALAAIALFLFRLIRQRRHPSEE